MGAASLNEIELRLAGEIEALDAFDASAWLGRTNDFPLMCEGTAQLIEAVHARCGIRGALLSHWLCRDDSSQQGNDLLLRAIDGHADWFAALTLHPLLPGQIDGPASPDWRWPSNVKAVRVFPASFNYALVDWCVGTLCEILVERRLPLVVIHTETSLQELYELARRYPKLPIILETQVKKISYHARMVLPLLKACPNIRLEMSNYCAHGMIEYTVRALGPDRLVFGTFAPACDPLTPLGLLLQADISWDDKKAVAGANMRQIISEARL